MADSGGVSAIPRRIIDGISFYLVLKGWRSKRSEARPTLLVVVEL